jgi:hypothetical protein
MTIETANDWKETTRPVRSPLFLGENHSQASKNEVIWNRLVPTAVKALCITIKVHTFVLTIKEIDPVSSNTLLTHRIAFIGIRNSM